MFFPSTFNHRLKATRTGFSMVELIIAVAIFALLSVVVIFNYNNYSDQIGLRNEAHALALAFREAQQFSMSVYSAKDASNNDVYPSWGVHFGLFTQNSYAIFADLDGDTFYTNSGVCGSPGEECYEAREFPKSIAFTPPCGVLLSNGTTKCLTSQLDVTFIRPNRDAVITGDGELYKSMTITLRSAKGKTRTVTVTADGYISVQ